MDIVDVLRKDEKVMEYVRICKRDGEEISITTLLCFASPETKEVLKEYLRSIDDDNM